jgi:hypothetical protein
MGEQRDEQDPPPLPSHLHGAGARVDDAQRTEDLKLHISPFSKAVHGLIVLNVINSCK